MSTPAKMLSNIMIKTKINFNWYSFGSKYILETTTYGIHIFRKRFSNSKLKFRNWCWKQNNSSIFLFSLCFYTPSIWMTVFVLQTTSLKKISKELKNTFASGTPQTLKKKLLDHSKKYAIVMYFCIELKNTCFSNENNLLKFDFLKHIFYQKNI